MTDPSECDHENVELTGEVEPQGDTVYKGGRCQDCGAKADAVYPRSHYLVWEDDEGDPVEVEA